MTNDEPGFELNDQATSDTPESLRRPSSYQRLNFRGTSYPISGAPPPPSPNEPLRSPANQLMIDAARIYHEAALRNEQSSPIGFHFSSDAPITVEPYLDDDALSLPEIKRQADLVGTQAMRLNEKIHATTEDIIRRLEASQPTEPDSVALPLAEEPEQAAPTIPPEGYAAYFDNAINAHINNLHNSD